jgi:DNA-binding NarL/FixJ family response regulator
MKLLIADDHWHIPESLENLFIKEKVEGGVVYKAATLAAAVQIAKDADRLDLIILDLHMPGMRKFAGIAIMQALCPTTPVAIMSADEDADSIRGAMEHGAAGYIPKTLPRDSVLAALRLLAAGMSFWPHGGLVNLRERKVRASGQATIVERWNSHEGGRADVIARAPTADTALPRFNSLTARERQVCELLLQGMSNKAIGENLLITELTVKEHVRSILAKTGYANRKQLLADKRG